MALGFLEAVLVVLLRSLFLYEYSWARRGSSLLLAIFLALAYFSTHSLPGLVVVLVVVYSWYALARMAKLAAYSSIIALLPASWMALTQALIEAGRGVFEPWTPVLVGLRALGIAMSSFFLLHFYNPLEASSLLYRVAGCRQSYVPLLLARIIGESLREAIEAVHAHRLKKAPAWKTLGLLLYRGQEQVPRYTEGVAYRVETCNPRPLYEAKTLVLQAASIVLVLVALIVSVPEPR